MDPFEHKTHIEDEDGNVIVDAHIDKPGITYSIIFPKKGVYKVRCLLHDGMVSTIRVK